MEALNELTQDLNSDSSNANIYTISTGKFIFLSLITFGLYNIWWMYSAWELFRDKEKRKIVSLVKAIFYPIFLFSLNEKIFLKAGETGYQKRYPADLLTIGFIFFSFLLILPYPFYQISVLSVIFTIPSFNAYNHILENSMELEVEKEISLNHKQIILALLGGLFWIIATGVYTFFNFSLRTD